MPNNTHSRALAPKQELMDMRTQLGPKTYTLKRQSKHRNRVEEELLANSPPSTSQGVSSTPVEAMKVVLEQQPELCRSGFYYHDRWHGFYGAFDPSAGIGRTGSVPPAEDNAHFQQERKKLLEEPCLTQFIAARKWLHGYAKASQFYTASSSYGLKHAAERDMEVYITNGAFIAAAIAEGFQIKRERNGPNCLINIAIDRGIGAKAVKVSGGGLPVICDGCG